MKGSKIAVGLLHLISNKQNANEPTHIRQIVQVKGDPNAIIADHHISSVSIGNSTAGVSGVAVNNAHPTIQNIVNPIDHNNSHHNTANATLSHQSGQNPSNWYVKNATNGNQYPNMHQVNSPSAIAPTNVAAPGTTPSLMQSNQIHYAYPGSPYLNNNAFNPGNNLPMAPVYGTMPIANHPQPGDIHVATPIVHSDLSLFASDPLFSKVNPAEITIVNAQYTKSSILATLATTGAELPWHWWHQCYNDDVTTCGQAILELLKTLSSNTAKEMKDHLKNILEKNPIAKDEDNLVKVMLAILAGTGRELDDVPLTDYLAFEMLLGMGFNASSTLNSNFDEKSIGILAFKTKHSQTIKHLRQAARLGYHRLVASLLDVGDQIRFSTLTEELKALLNESREQPFCLTEILRRVTEVEVRKQLTLECTACHALPQAIYRSRSVEVPKMDGTGICFHDGRMPSTNIHTHFLTNASLSRIEQVMLARSFLNMVMELPFVGTLCPKCLDTQALPETNVVSLINIMLESFCMPRSKFRLVD